MQLKGKLIKWNAEKAFGFIAPFAGGSHIFIHISAFRNKRRIPALNDIIMFKVAKDKDGRYCAIEAIYEGEKARNKNEKGPSKFSLVLAIAFLLSVIVTTYTGLIPHAIKYLYLGLSFITFFVYAYDKYKAQRKAWRVAEKTLHILSIVGGWPGAALAQQLLRHKSSKPDFRSIFWITVVLNLSMLGWLLSPYGETVLSLVSAFGKGFV